MTLNCYIYNYIIYTLFNWLFLFLVFVPTFFPPFWEAGLIAFRWGKAGIIPLGKENLRFQVRALEAEPVRMASR